MRTKFARDLIRKEHRREQGLSKSENRLLIKQMAQQDVLNSLKLWKQIHPKISTVNAKMVSLLKDTEDLVRLLEEPVYLVEMKDSGEIKLCHRRDLTVVR